MRKPQTIYISATSKRQAGEILAAVQKIIRKHKGARVAIWVDPNSVNRFMESESARMARVLAQRVASRSPWPDLLRRKNKRHKTK